MSRLRRFWANPYKLQLLGRKLQHLKERVWGSRAPAWSRRDLIRLLWLNSDLRSHFQNRLGPRFFFTAADLEHILAATPAAARQALVLQARRQLLDRTFEFRGQPPVTLTPDWQVPNGSVPDPEWLRDWHRLEWLVEGLLASYYEAAPELLPAAAAALVWWYQTYPPGSAPWQDPFEVAQRAYTLTWLFFLGLAQPQWPEGALISALQALLAHGLWLAARLEYQAPNNHLLLEALRLAQVGLLLPEFPAAAAWRRRGQTIYRRELSRQILPDGFHAELSVFYQRLVLEGLLEEACLWRCQGLAPPPPLLQVLPRMLWTLGQLQRPDGSYPEIGDGFAGDVLLRHDPFILGQHLTGATYGVPAFNLKTLWLLGGRWPPGYRRLARPDWHYWPAAGYWLSRRDGEPPVRLLLDLGPFGYPPAPGHGHADCLSLLLEVNGRPLLVDAGTGSYADRQWRSYWRGTAAHNTVVVAGRDQTPLADLFASGHPAWPRLEALVVTERLRLVVASHDGYCRLRPPVRHCRLLLDLPGGNYLILDLMDGQGRQQCSQYWHLPPPAVIREELQAWSCHLEQTEVLSLVFAATQAGTLAVVSGQHNPPQGWLAGPDGRPRPAPVLVWKAYARLPAAVATLIQVQPQPRAAVELQELPGGLACQVTAPHWTTLALVRQGPQGPWAWSEWETDARFLVHWHQDGQEALLLAHGREVRRQGQPLLILPAATPGLVVTSRP